MRGKSEYWQTIVKQTANSTGQIEPFFSLAPMEAVTDTVFRLVVDKAAPADVYYTEFTNAISVTHPKAKFSVAGRLYVDQAETKQPIVQLWGAQPEEFESAAKAVAQMGYQAIDINTGCPDSAVIKNGGGSDLMRHPERAQEVIEATKQAGLPVSVKTRLGFNQLEERFDWLPFLLEQDIEVLTVHLRTRKEMSKVPAHYELIDEILKMRDEISPNTLIQINGDVKDYQAGMDLAQAHPGIDGFMIGRGVFESPYAFEKQPQAHTLPELVALLRYQLDLYDQFTAKIGQRRFEQLKRFFKIYVRGVSHAADLRQALYETNSTDEVREVLAHYQLLS